jgi:hypothetical protein
VIAGFFITACGSVSEEVRGSDPRLFDPPTTPTISPANIAEENFKKDWTAQFEATKAEIEKNRKKWNERAIKSYSFVVSKFAGGNTNSWNGGPVEIEVNDGNVLTRKPEKERIFVQSSIEEDFKDFDTIDKLFAHILYRLENGEIVEANYDSRLGFPKMASFVFTYTTNHNSLNIQVTDFRIKRE